MSFSGWICRCFRDILFSSCFLEARRCGGFFSLSGGGGGGRIAYCRMYAVKWVRHGCLFLHHTKSDVCTVKGLMQVEFPAAISICTFTAVGMKKAFYGHRGGQKGAAVFRYSPLHRYSLIGPIETVIFFHPPTRRCHPDHLPGRCPMRNFWGVIFAICCIGANLPLIIHCSGILHRYLHGF